MKGLGKLLAPLGALCWLGGMLLGAYELTYWLKKGTWLHLTLAAPFGPFITNDHSGVAQILTWLIAIAFGPPGALLIVGLVLGWVRSGFRKSA